MIVGYVVISMFYQCSESSLLKPLQPLWLVPLGFVQQSKKGVKSWTEYYRSWYRSCEPGEDVLHPRGALAIDL